MDNVIIRFKVAMGLALFHKKDKKLKELVLYVAEKSKDDPHFGLTKLNKILFLIDFEHYAWRGEPLTGAKYVHRQKGPVPNQMLGVLEALQSEQRAEIKEVDRYGYTQRRLVPLKGADTSIFDEEELTLINSSIDKVTGLNARDISEWTHKLKPWQITEEGEEIPYYSIYVLRDSPIERASFTWAKQEIERLKKEYNYVP